MTSFIKDDAGKVAGVSSPVDIQISAPGGEHGSGADHSSGKKAKKKQGGKKAGKKNKKKGGMNKRDENGYTDDSQTEFIFRPGNENVEGTPNEVITAEGEGLDEFILRPVNENVEGTPSEVVMAEGEGLDDTDMGNLVPSRGLRPKTAAAFQRKMSTKGGSRRRSKTIKQISSSRLNMDIQDDRGEDEAAEPEEAKEEETMDKPVNTGNAEEDKEGDTEGETEDEPPPGPPRYPSSKSDGTAEGAFDIMCFNDAISQFSDIFADPQYANVDCKYNMEEMKTALASMSGTLIEFKDIANVAEKNLGNLRSKLIHIKENLHLAIVKQTPGFTGERRMSIEESKLNKRVSELNIEKAKANEEMAKAVLLTTEAEDVALNAQILVEKAIEDAKFIEQEERRKVLLEAKLKRDEEKRLKEEKIKAVEDRKRKIEEERLKKEEWDRMVKKELELEAQKEAPLHEYICDELYFIIRGDHDFQKEEIDFEVIETNDIEIVFNDPYEELIANVLSLTSSDPEKLAAAPVSLFIPHLMGRLASAAREPVIKVKNEDDVWNELHTSDVTLESRKDMKFAQTKFNHVGTFIVVSRFKQDYFTLTHESLKMTSSYDPRITLSVPEGMYKSEQHFMMKVQPIDSASVQDFTTRSQECKRLLSSSPLIIMQWQSNKFSKNIKVSLPCPTNPAKARMMANLRREKEEKMKKPIPLIPPEEEDKKKKKKGEPVPTEDLFKPKIRWYMGDYAANDDDETDIIYLFAFLSGKWIVVQDVEITQLKMEMVTFPLKRGYEKILLCRYRTSVGPASAVNVTTFLLECLAERYAHVIVRQRNEDACKLMICMIPPNMVEKTMHALDDNSFERGPPVSLRVPVYEGCIIDLAFRGNIMTLFGIPVSFTYHSFLKSCAYFNLQEVDKYRQKAFEEYKGVIRVSRRKVVIPEGEEEPKPIVTQIFLCDLHVSIPKLEEQSSAPETAPLVISTYNVISEPYLQELSSKIGTEWIKLAKCLHITHERVQAIIRNIAVAERNVDEVKLVMLLTWLKRTRKADNKVNILKTALVNCGRQDLSDDLDSLECLYNERSWTNDEGNEHRSSLQSDDSVLNIRKMLESPTFEQVVPQTKMESTIKKESTIKMASTTKMETTKMESTMKMESTTKMETIKMESPMKTDSQIKIESQEKSES